MAHFENDNAFDFHLYIHFANHLDFEQRVGISVSRKAFTQFFVEFLDLCCVGNRSKVPYPKQGVCKDNWKAIARVFGYATIYNIFPRNLCRTAAKMFMLGVRANDTEIKEDLLMYLSTPDGQVIQQFIDNFEQPPDKYEKLLEVLSRLRCPSMPTAENFSLILVEIGEYMLLQKPFFPFHSMCEMTQNFVFPANFNLVSVLNGEMTHQKISEQMVALPEIPEQVRSWNSLKELLRGASVDILELFLSFVNDSSLILTGIITVNFESMWEVGRGPFSHSCSLSLTVPSNLNAEQMRDCLCFHLSLPMEFDMV